jgi:hypothetical protein
MGWITLLLFVGAEPLDPPSDARTAYSPNFVVRCSALDHDARSISQTAERWRARLQTFWCGVESPPWNPRCELIVHPSKAAYLAVVGRGGEQTAGSSWIEFSQQAPSKRRIDLLGTKEDPLSAFPHELTHVIFADLFQGRQPPRWADEGAAMLADSHEKLRLHQRDLEHALRQRTSFAFAELLSLEHYPAAHRVAGFYGQSASVTAFLTRRDDPSRFVLFVRHALDHGYDEALVRVYRIASLRHLERDWLEHHQGAKGFHGLQLTLSERPADPVE